MIKVINVEKFKSLTMLIFFNKSKDRNAKKIEIRIFRLTKSNELSNFLISLNSGIIKMMQIAEIT